MISDPFVRNALLYVGTMLVGALAAGLSVLMIQLAGVDPINFRPILAAALGPIVTGLLARQLTRGGREELGNLVDQVGVPQAKAALEVAAMRQEAGASTLTVSAIADELERRRDERVKARLLHTAPADFDPKEARP